jgi:hypothetical protein
MCTERMSTAIVFKEELDFFMANQRELVLAHRGMVLVIRGREVVGVYPSALEAYVDAQKSYELGTFMIQPCEPGPGAYSVTLSSACISA